MFCDHILSIARQENISFAEAATKIKETGFEGVGVRVRPGRNRLHSET
ncbi:MAG: hypothetical protein IJK73_00665 [Bacteroidales bacterium]|nr:hypothetical protein [Bacteroidales bacterium]